MNVIYKHFRVWPLRSNPRAVSMLLHLISHATPVQVHADSKTTRRGQLRTSIGKLGKELGMTKQECRVTLNQLVKNGDVTRHAERRETLITVREYDKFQEPEVKRETTYNTNKVADKLCKKIREVVNNPFFNEKKGIVTAVFPISQGGVRNVQVICESDLGYVIKAGGEVVKRERVL